MRLKTSEERTDVLRIALNNVTVGRKKTIIIRQKLEEYLIEHRAI